MVKPELRIYRALKEGWSFGDIKYPPNFIPGRKNTSRMSIWAKDPKDEGWRCHKSDISISDALDQMGL